ncbi:MAG TPA: methyl-accepting chemotaxis protein [Spirochaetota bacterium]|nr:methyl-accepting chemotaxis protein [Spirochaetota bacterium]HNU91636.1 methyl-accepting chemotaxis protein [Spirochaetota bacterium]
MKRIMDYFLIRYNDASFFKKKLTKSFLVLCFVIFMVTLPVFFVSLLFFPETFMTTGPVSGSIFIFAIISMFILRSGRYNFAANLMVSVFVLIILAGAFARTVKAPHTIYSSSFYYLMVAVVIATLYCTRRWVIGFGIFFILNNFVVFYLIKGNLDATGLQAATWGVIHFTVTITVITILSQLIASIFNATLDELKLEFKKNDDQLGIIKRLLRSARKASGQLTEMSGSLSKTSVTFAETSHTQAASVEELTSAIEEISAGMDSMANGSQEQAQSLELLISHIRELSSVIMEVGETTRTMMGQTDSTTSEARAGEQSLRKMNESLGKIVESSRDIKNIIGIIDDISDRINLLSLNAAIEAARAGEAGRGFAVVADEISKLADQTASSIKEIDTLIRSSNQEVEKGMGDIMEVTAKITSVIEAVNSIAGGMKRVYEYVQRQEQVNQSVNAQSENVRLKTSEISGSIEEEKSALGEIVKSISEINEATQLMATESDRISGDSNKISDLSSDLEEVMASHDAN